MSEQTNEFKNTDRTPLDGGDHGSADTVDAMLATLTRFAQQTPGFAVGVTLTVRGATITGVLVGRNDWLEQLHAEHGEKAGGLTSAWLETMAFDPAEKPERLDREGFIHLVGARTLSGGAATPSFGSPGTYWRGLLASVDGWSLGSISD